MTKFLQGWEKMSCRRHSSILILAAILLKLTPLNLAVMGFFTYDLGPILCSLNTNKKAPCLQIENVAYFRDIFNFQDGASNLTAPHVSFFSEGFFNVRTNNFGTFRKVHAFFVTAEGAEVDIELISSPGTVTVTCSSNGSYSKVSSNIFRQSDGSKDAHKNTNHYSQWHPHVKKRFSIYISEHDLISGHFTCSSMDGEGPAETIYLFTQTAENFREKRISPFVPVRELTVRSDDTGLGFIVPCRTHYRAETAPDLLWTNSEQGTFSSVTAEEMTSFRWDQRVGFKFNSSRRMWEISTFACRLGTHEKVFLPSPSLFKNLYVVTVDDYQIDCKIFERNHSNNQLLRSQLNFIAKQFHTCVNYNSCDLDLEMGTLELKERIFRINEESTIANQIGTRGVFSCSFEHIYENSHVPETNYQKFFEGLDSKIYLLPGLYPNSSVIRITQVDNPLYKIKAELYHKFTCTIVEFVRTLPGASVEFKLRFTNKTEVVYPQNVIHQPETKSVAHFNVSLNSNLTHVICNIRTNDGTLVSAESPLQIIDASAPKTDKKANWKKIFQMGDFSDNHILVCPITGEPSPNYQWNFDEKNSKFITETNTRNLTFRKIQEDLAGIYICHALNDLGNDSFRFEVSIKPQGFFKKLTPITIAWIGSGSILGLIGLVATTLFALKFCKTKRQTRNLTPEESLEFLDGTMISGENLPGSEHSGPNLAVRLPFTKRIELSSLIVDRATILGQGKYGIVYRGILRSEAVAVKTFKRAVTHDDFRACLVEVKLMSFVGEHPNIVQFMGADVTNIEKRDILIVMELSTFGSLEKHLRILQASTQSSFVIAAALCETTNGKLIRQKLFFFCEQIAFAMEHLESKNVIHGDLAARNVLVFDHDVVKVTDFGYSLQLYENSVYKPKKNRSLPWRSSSIELLRRMEFSTESDIWAFGVTVWEIFTFGNVPFSSVRYSDQFVKSLEEGLRLERPAGLCESQYALLMECWNAEKSVRPRFSVLKAFFSLERV